MLVLGGVRLRGVLHDLGWSEEGNEEDVFSSAASALNAHFSGLSMTPRRLRFSLLCGGDRGRPLNEERPREWRLRLLELAKRASFPGGASAEDDAVVLVMARYCLDESLRNVILSEEEMGKSLFCGIIFLFCALRYSRLDFGEDRSTFGRPSK